jgi:CheY-like chemotaxis protein
MKVLIAEDSPSTRLYLVKIFEEYGHTVFSVENGLDAWEKLKNEKIDILITDWMMPEMDGITLCKKIRSHARFKYNYIYIIFLTSKNGKNDLIEVFASGADDYIKKPFDHAELLARIKTAERITELEKRHGRDKEDLLRRSEVIDKRVRELNCLYSVSDLVNTPGITPNEILKKSIELIHPSLHGPVTSHIRITTEDTLYETDGFNPFGCKLEQNLYVHGKTFGTIEIYHPDCFTEEERKLVKTLSNRLGSALEKISIEQKVKDDERRYRNILENIEEGYFEVDLAGNFKLFHV